MTTEHKSTTSETQRQGNTVADWQPIETADLFGSVIVCTEHGLVGEAWHLPWGEKTGWYWIRQHPSMNDALPIHPVYWAHLPPPPEVR